MTAPRFNSFLLIRSLVLPCLPRVARGHAQSNSDRRSNCFARTGGAGVRVLGRAIMPALNDRDRRRIGDALIGAAALAAVVRFAGMVIV